MQPIIYDTTLREGMQTPGGIGATLEERVYAANLIAKYADWIEVGMPANQLDYIIIKKIKKSFEEHGRDVGIAVLCRIDCNDIDKGEDVLKNYKKTLAHLFIGTSEEHRKSRLVGWATEDYEHSIKEKVKYAAEKPFSRIMFSPEDSYRTFKDTPYAFFRFVDAAIVGYEEGSKKAARKEKLVLNFPDTVGYSTLSEFDVMLKKVNQQYKGKIEISLHHHNDSGTATPQLEHSYALGQAHWLQSTFGCLGERNGISQTESLIAILNERGLINKERLHELVPTTHAILGALGRTVPAEALLSGCRTNVSTAGIHTAAAGNNEKAYHINHKRYGGKTQIEFGPTSGSHQIIPYLEEIGIHPDKGALHRYVEALKDKCNLEKRIMTNTDIKYYAIRAFSDFEDPLKVEDYTCRVCSMKKTEISIKGIYKKIPFCIEIAENGPLEATIRALNQVINEGITLQLIEFAPSVIPKIPQEYLIWEKGNYPRLPSGLDIHSELRAITIVRNKGNDEAYHGFATKEDSFQTIIESAIDAVVKMATIEGYTSRK